MPLSKQRLDSAGSQVSSLQISDFVSGFGVFVFVFAGDCLLRTHVILSLRRGRRHPFRTLAAASRREPPRATACRHQCRIDVSCMENGRAGAGNGRCRIEPPGIVCFGSRGTETILKPLSVLLLQSKGEWFGDLNLVEAPNCQKAWIFSSTQS